MILWLLDSLTLKEEDDLVLAYNPNYMTMKSLMHKVVLQKYPNAHLIELKSPTRGAAETVLLALQQLPQKVLQKPIMVMDGDTFYQNYDVVSKYRIPRICNYYGASVVFKDENPDAIFSYCVVGIDNKISRIKEKCKISDWANAGCYCFRSGEGLMLNCQKLIARGEAGT